MAQKVQIYKNTNEESKIYGKYLVRPVYDNRFVETKQLADFIQTQCTVKHSDIVAVLRELGEAFKHFFEMGQKVKLDGIGSSRWASAPPPPTPRQPHRPHW